MDDSNEHKGNSSPSTLKAKFKSSLCLSCCLRRHRNDHHHLHRHRRMSSTSSESDVPGPPPAPLTRSFSVKDKSRSSSRDSPEVKSDWRPQFISRIGRHGRRHSASADFHYDPLSYALNFDEGYDETFPLRNFSSRLPASPPKSTPSPSNTSREIITAYS